MLLRMAVRPRPWRRPAALLQVWREDRVSQLLLRGLLASQALCWSGSGECEPRGWVIACAPLRNGGGRVGSNATPGEETFSLLPLLSTNSANISLAHKLIVTLGPPARFLF